MVVTVCSFVKFVRSFIDRQPFIGYISMCRSMNTNEAYVLGSAGKGSVQK
jgi:hypothetical protein